MYADTVSEAGALLIAHDAREALKRGTFDLPGRHLSLNLLMVDDQGWADLTAIFAWALAETRDVQAAVMERGDPLLQVEAAMMLFGRQ